MDDSKFYSIDDSLWPFVLIELRGKATDEEYAEYLQVSTLHLESHGPRLIVLDMMQARFNSTVQIHQQADWMRTHEAALREKTLGCGFSVASAFIRLGMSVIYYLSPPPSPYLIAPTLEQAIVWGAQRLEDLGHGECARRVRQHHLPRYSVRAG